MIALNKHASKSLVKVFAPNLDEVVVERAKDAKTRTVSTSFSREDSMEKVLAILSTAKPIR